MHLAFLVVTSLFLAGRGGPRATPAQCDGYIWRSYELGVRESSKRHGVPYDPALLEKMRRALTGDETANAELRFTRVEQAAHAAVVARCLRTGTKKEIDCGMRATTAEQAGDCREKLAGPFDVHEQCLQVTAAMLTATENSIGRQAGVNVTMKSPQGADGEGMVRACEKESTQAQRDCLLRADSIDEALKCWSGPK